MQGVAHTIPFLITTKRDLEMAELCLSSLARSDPGSLVVLYNQGQLTKEEVGSFTKKYNLQVEVLGDGQNVGIAAGRVACFRHIWANLPDIEFVSEIHVDMIFPEKWIKDLVDFLRCTDEPMICPGILTLQGELHPDAKGKPIITEEIPIFDWERMNCLLRSLTSAKIVEGFVHPVVHKSDVLRSVGGYDTRFIKGKQGYEDDSLLLSYRYYLGTKSNWRPKCLLSVRVFHATLFQRMSLPSKEEDFNRNLTGLIFQFGVKGLIELGKLHGENLQFSILAKEMIDKLESC